MKKDFSKTAFSLIELIIATVLVSVVLLGIFSINMTLNNSGQDYGQRYLVKSQTQTTLNHILNNASLAYGSGNTDDEAILIGTNSYPVGGPYDDNNGVGDANTFCIHQQGIINGGNDIVGSAQDIWLCYSWHTSSDLNVPYQIFWCAETYGPTRTVPITTDPRGATSCATAQSGGTLVTGTGVTFLGTSYNGITTVALPSTSNPAFISTAGPPAQTLFSVTIQNCLNDTALSCYNGNPSLQDPVNNPQVQLSGSIIPLSTSS